MTSKWHSIVFALIVLVMETVVFQKVAYGQSAFTKESFARANFEGFIRCRELTSLEDTSQQDLVHCISPYVSVHLDSGDERALYAWFLYKLPVEITGQCTTDVNSRLVHERAEFVLCGVVYVTDTPEPVYFSFSGKDEAYKLMSIAF